ncbi:hypothetical protein AB0D91_05050 [Streptomyces canus]|uniref:DUF7167 family protein n=1 Tax=Streptomyces canus TaxID=58343 RepID=UPI0034076370
MTNRIVVHVGMHSIAGSTQEIILEGNEIPVGWDQMTDDEKQEIMDPIVQDCIANEVDAGWGEE